MARAVVIVMAALVAGCSSIETSYDYDPKANFAGLKTYEWLKEPQKLTGDPRIDGNTILANRIYEAVDTELAARGFRKISGDPDFLVAYHVSLDKRRSVQTLNSYYGYGPKQFPVLFHRKGLGTASGCSQRSPGQSQGW